MPKRVLPVDPKEQTMLQQAIKKMIKRDVSMFIFELYIVGAFLVAWICFGCLHGNLIFPKDRSKLPPAEIDHAVWSSFFVYCLGVFGICLIIWGGYTSLFTLRYKKRNFRTKHFQKWIVLQHVLKQYALPPWLDKWNEKLWTRYIFSFLDIIFLLRVKKTCFVNKQKTGS